MYGEPVIRHEILKKTHAREARLEHGRSRPWQSRRSGGRRARWGSCGPPGAPHGEASRKGLKFTFEKSWGAFSKQQLQFCTCIYITCIMTHYNMHRNTLRQYNINLHGITLYTMHHNTRLIYNMHHDVHLRINFRVNFRVGVLDDGESANVERWFYAKTSTNSFQSRHFLCRCPPKACHVKQKKSLMKKNRWWNPYQGTYDTRGCGVLA